MIRLSSLLAFGILLFAGTCGCGSADGPSSPLSQRDTAEDASGSGVEPNELLESGYEEPITSGSGGEAPPASEQTGTTTPDAANSDHAAADPAAGHDAEQAPWDESNPVTVNEPDPSVPLDSDVVSAPKKDTPPEVGSQIAELPSDVVTQSGSANTGVRVRRDGATKDHRGYSPERVFFATNREPLTSAEAVRDPDLYFGDERGDLSWGVCEVSIPYKRQPGTMPEPSILRLEFTQDPAKHVVLMEIEQLRDAEFWKRLRAKVDASSEKQLMLFIHGYCATFRDAARRTAQISYDLNYQGAAMFFSWPAGSDLESFEQRANYVKDLRRAQDSDDDLVSVIQKISRFSGAKRVHLIAHSMGNYVLTEALKTIDDRLSDGRVRPMLFDQVILAAPDINAKEYVKKNGLGQRLKPFAKRYTVYASTADKALWLSKSVNGYEPLGFLNSYSQGGARDSLYDLVDASQLTQGWFDSGHIYYGDMPEVLIDLGYIFRGIQAKSLQRGLAETPPMYRLSRRSP